MPISILSGLLIVLFLSGNIIDIPKGTHPAGVVSALGVLIILAVSFVLNYLLFLAIRPRQKR